MINEKQVHVVVGCADARALCQVQLDAIENVTEYFLAKGIAIEYHVIRTAGFFVTLEVAMDLKRTVEQAQRNSTDSRIPFSYYVHLQTHGHLTQDSNDDYISHVRDLRIVEGCLLNCGMLQASSVGVEI